MFEGMEADAKADTARSLPPQRVERVRGSLLTYSMSRRVDPTTVGDMPREQSWWVDVREDDEDPYATLAVHRVPLNNGEDIVVSTDSGDRVPGGPVFRVVDGDRLRPSVRRRLSDPEQADDSYATFLVVEPIEVDEGWRGPGVAEFLLATVLVELQSTDDVIAAAEPVRWHLKGRARTLPAAIQHPVFTNVGFSRFEHGTWLLTDWSRLHRAHEYYSQQFLRP